MTIDIKSLVQLSTQAIQASGSGEFIAPSGATKTKLEGPADDWIRELCSARKESCDLEGDRSVDQGGIPASTLADDLKSFVLSPEKIEALIGSITKALKERVSPMHAKERQRLKLIEEDFLSKISRKQILKNLFKEEFSKVEVIDTRFGYRLRVSLARNSDTAQYLPEGGIGSFDLSYSPKASRTGDIPCLSLLIGSYDVNNPTEYRFLANSSFMREELADTGIEEKIEGLITESREGKIEQSELAIEKGRVAQEKSSKAGPTSIPLSQKGFAQGLRNLFKRS